MITRQGCEPSRVDDAQGDRVNPFLRPVRVAMPVMIKVIRSTHRLGAVQNCLAVTVFAFLAAAHASAVLLYLGVRNDWSWFVSIHLNRMAAPALDFYYDWFAAGPFLALGLLAAFCLLPLWAQLRRSWIGTSVAGHLALGISVLLVSAALQRAAPDVKSASLGDVAITFEDLTSVATLLAVTVALAVLCIVNHIAFFAEDRRGLPTSP
jgi:hypothetical protein